MKTLFTISQSSQRISQISSRRCWSICDEVNNVNTNSFDSLKLKS